MTKKQKTFFLAYPHGHHLELTFHGVKATSLKEAKKIFTSNTTYRPKQIIVKRNPPKKWGAGGAYRYPSVKDGVYWVKDGRYYTLYHVKKRQVYALVRDKTRNQALEVQQGLRAAWQLGLKRKFPPVPR